MASSTSLEMSHFIGTGCTCSEFVCKCIFGTDRGSVLVALGNKGVCVICNNLTVCDVKVNEALTFYTHG